LTTATVLALFAVAAGQPAHAADGWTQPTETSFWSNAASAATATTYAPASPPLHRARVGSFDFANSGLHMFCADQWSVTAVYGMTGIRAVTIEQGTDNGSQDPVCLGDGPGANGPPNETTVTIAGARITIDFWGCTSGPKPSGFPEAKCPASKAQYIADGRLPAAGSKRPTALHISSVGISRRSLTAIIQSLTVVPAP
jgi:hypothetical protein